jgi:hypothetical protein
MRTCEATRRVAGPALDLQSWNILCSIRGPRDGNGVLVGNLDAVVVTIDELWIGKTI